MTLVYPPYLPLLQKLEQVYHQASWGGLVCTTLRWLHWLKWQMKWQISLSKNLPTKRNGNILKKMARFLLFWQVQNSKTSPKWQETCQKSVVRNYPNNGLSLFRLFLTQPDLSVENGLFRLKPTSGFLTQSKRSFFDSTFFDRVFRLGDPVKNLAKKVSLEKTIIEDCRFLGRFLH